MKKPRKYISESHRKYCEGLQKEIDEMAKNPLSREEMEAQCDRIRQASQAERTPDTEEDTSKS